MLFLFVLKLYILILTMSWYSDFEDSTNIPLFKGLARALYVTIHIKCLASRRHLVGIVSFFLYTLIGVIFHWCLGDIISSMRPNIPKSGE